MHNLTRRIVCLAMTGALAMAGLAGCGGQAEQATPAQSKEPSSAAELAEMNEKTSGAKNHHFQGELEISLDIVGQALPVKTSIEGDTVDGNTHLTMSTELMGEKQQTEMYIVKDGNSYVQYSASKTGGEAQQWSKAAIGSNPLDALSNKSLLSEGEFSKDSETYTITLTGDQVLNAIIGNDKDLEKIVKDVSTKELQDALKNGKITSTFDKAANNTSENLNLSFGVKREFMGQQLEMSIKLGANVKLTDHGKVDASKVAVPDNVKSGAVDAAAGLNDFLKQIEQLTGIPTTAGATPQAAA